MNYAYFKHELSLMLKSKKNIMFVLFLTALLFSYCFVILPNQQTVNSFDTEQMKISLIEMKDLQKSRESQGATGFIGMAGLSVYAADELKYSILHAKMKAFENEEASRFLRLRYTYWSWNPSKFLEDEKLFPNSPFPRKDRTHFFAKTMKRYEGYLTGELPVSFEIIEEKTALQVFQNLLLSPWIYLFAFCAIYFSSDVLVRDRTNRTVLQGMPIGWYRLLNLKTAASLLYIGIVLSFLMFLGTAFLTLQNGFGYAGHLIPTTVEAEIIGQVNYEMITIGKFIALSMAGVILLIYLFARLSFVLSLLFKNEWLVLLVGTLILFAERLYFARDLREIFGIEIKYFPQTYFEIGQVLTGEKNFLVNITTLSYSQGMILFAVTIVIVEILLWALSRVIYKQKFYGIH